MKAAHFRQTLFLCVALLSGASAWAQLSPQLDGLKIDKIEIYAKEGFPVRPSVVHAFMKLKVGGTFTRQELSMDIKRLFDSRFFSDIEVDVRRAGPRAVKLILQLQAKTVIRGILFHGAKQIKAKSLCTELTIQKREMFQEGKLSEDIAALYEKYSKKGYHGTIIRYFVVDSEEFLKLAVSHLDRKHQVVNEQTIMDLFDDEQFFGDFKRILLQHLDKDGKALVPHRSGKVHVLFWISECPRYVSTNVTIERADAVRSRMSTWRNVLGRIFSLGLIKPSPAREIAKTHPLMTKEAWWFGYTDNDAIREDVSQIRSWYSDNGYFDAKVKSVAKRLGKTPILRRPKTDITFTVEEGKPYVISKITITGNERFTTEQLMRLIEFKKGDIYTKKAETLSIKELEKRYHRLGYLDLRITTKQSSDPNKNTVGINFEINEGKPARVRDIHVMGNYTTHDNVIRRELLLLPGQYADKGKIRASRNRLRQLRYFKNVEILPVATADENYKDLNVEVEEGDTGRFAAAVSFSDANSSMVSVEFGESNFNLFAPQRYFRGGGQRFRVKAAVGSGTTDFSVNFTEPWLFDRRLRFDVEAWNRSTTLNRDYNQDSVGEQLKLTKQLPWRYWRAYFGHRLERIDINNIDDAYSTKFIQDEEGEQLVSAFVGGLVRDSRDRVVFPNSGAKVTLSGEYQSESLGSYLDLYKLNLRADYYVPIFSKSVVRFSGRFGHINKIHGDDNVKVFDRYFAGGNGSIRGFKSREVGPIDPSNEEPVGGKSTMILSTEVLVPLFEETLYGAVFADAGNVWPGSWGWAFDDLNVGVGAGLRFRLPIGATLSLDYGIPITTRQLHLSDKPRLHFNLGYNF